MKDLTINNQPTSSEGVVVEHTPIKFTNWWD